MILHRRKASGDPLVAADAPDLAHRSAPRREHTSGVSDLFSEAAGRRLEASAPLAQRLRPTTLDDFVGQEHVVGPGRALRLAIEQDRVPSLILYGPPGSGQDDPRADRRAHDRRRVRGALRGLRDGRERAAGPRPGARAARRRAAAARSSSSTRSTASTRRSRTHCSPASRTGLLTLIGATTENPYFEVNSALLSRAQIYELEPHSIETLRAVVRRGAAELAAEVPPDVEELIAQRAGGDARNALNILELSVETARAAGEPIAAHTSTTRHGSARSPTTRAATALRLHLGLDQVDAGERRPGVDLLPRGDARRRRGRALHRPPDDRARFRGHRQRRPAGATRRRRGGSRRRSKFVLFVSRCA